ncbi:MAG: DegT/DnrJ/EryC1/StrS family aminotransferase [Myxococcota bacterium]
MAGVEFYRHALGSEEVESIVETLHSLFLTLGPRTAEFERCFATFMGSEHAVGTNSCSAGLVLALRALDIGPGDEVITTPMTFVSTPNAVLHVGANVVFVDVERRTGLIDPAAVERAITARTRAILPVHLYGQMADMRAIAAIARRNDLRVVEDAAHAVEAERDGVKPGQLADMAVFSFYATKNLTSGDGGAIALHSTALAERLRRLRNHGITKDAATRYGQSYRHWDMLELGYKAAMNDLDAALLIPQLSRVRERWQRRCQLVARYRQLLANEPRVELIEPAGESAHHLFAIKVAPETRDPLLAELGARGIGCAVNYRSVHTLSYFEKLGHRRDDYPQAADFGERTLTLPLWPDMPLASVDTAVAELRASLDALDAPRTFAESCHG